PVLSVEILENNLLVIVDISPGAGIHDGALSVSRPGQNRNCAWRGQVAGDGYDGAAVIDPGHCSRTHKGARERAGRRALVDAGREESSDRSEEHVTLGVDIRIVVRAP